MCVKGLTDVVHDNHHIQSNVNCQTGPRVMSGEFSKCSEVCEVREVCVCVCVHSFLISIQDNASPLSSTVYDKVVK